MDLNTTRLIERLDEVMARNQALRQRLRAESVDVTMLLELQRKSIEEIRELVARV